MCSIDYLQIHQYCLSLWNDAVHKGNIELAIKIDFEHYNKVVKPCESKYFWDLWQNSTYPLRKVLTEQAYTMIPIIHNNNFESKNFLIILPNYSGLAHEQQLSRNLRYLWSENYSFEFEIVYLFGLSDQYKAAASKLYNISPSKINFLNSKSYSEASKLLNLLVSQREFCTILYPSFFQLAFWMSLFLPHPNQKFLQMKYFPKQTGRIAGWACGRKNFEQYLDYESDLFLQLSVLNLKLFPDDSFIDSEPKIRNNITFGSISRPEKISDAIYNKTVLELLNSNDKLEYLYTGIVENLKFIPVSTLNHPQSRHIGWVAPTQSIKLFDIYFESFPWGGGDMSLLALQSARPYLTLETTENKLIGISDFLRIISENNSDITYFSFADNIQTLTDRFNQLCRDKFLREELGQAWQSAILKYEPCDADKWYDFLTT
jgi:hypothetical protein